MAFNSDPQNLLAREIYSKYLSGADDTTIGYELDIAPDVVKSIREGYEQSSVEKDIDKPAASTKWRERIEVWIARLDLEYTGGHINIDKAIVSFHKLAALGIDLDGLAADKKIDINLRGSRVDQEIENLLGQFPAEAEEDTPL